MRELLKFLRAYVSLVIGSDMAVSGGIARHEGSECDDRMFELCLSIYTSMIDFTSGNSVIYRSFPQRLKSFGKSRPVL
jgi:hypothetical protein